QNCTKLSQTCMVGLRRGVVKRLWHGSNTQKLKIVSGRDSVGFLYHGPSGWPGERIYGVATIRPQMWIGSSMKTFIRPRAPAFKIPCDRRRGSFESTSVP